MITEEAQFDISFEEFEIAPTYLSIIEKIRSIASFFSRSGVAQDSLNKICVQKNIPIKKISVDVMTRWCSVYTMFKSFLELQPAIEQCYLELEKNFDFAEMELRAITVFILKYHILFREIN